MRLVHELLLFSRATRPMPRAGCSTFTVLIHVPIWVPLRHILKFYTFICDWCYTSYSRIFTYTIVDSIMVRGTRGNPRPAAGFFGLDSSGLLTRRVALQNDSEQHSSPQKAEIELNSASNHKIYKKNHSQPATTKDTLVTVKAASKRSSPKYRPIRNAHAELMPKGSCNYILSWIGD